jgi:hypothetical protein
MKMWLADFIVSNSTRRIPPLFRTDIWQAVEMPQACPPEYEVCLALPLDTSLKNKELQPL